MSAKPTSAGQSPLVKLALIGSVGIGFFYLNDGLQHLQLRIADLPVQGKAQQAQVAAPPDAVAAANLAKNMHPLLVESKTKAATLKEGPAGGANLDALFGRDQAQQELDARKKKEADAEKAAKASQSAAAASAPGAPAVAVPAMPAIDHFKLLALKVRVQAVMKDGAVINEDFCELGAEVKSLGYPSADGTKTLYPRLHSVDGEVVLLAEAGAGVRKIRAKLLH